MGKAQSTSQRVAEARNIPGMLTVGDLASVNYGIENLVFASGGSLSFAYAGAMRVVEKIGVLKGVKRFAGVGTGAIIAALLVVGFDSNGIQDALEIIIEKLIDDDRIGFENTPENIYNDYGWNYGDSFQQTFDNLLASKMDENDLTFLKLYERTGKELCITTSNVDKLSIEYFHPKTTPSLRISRAVFMSLTIPGIFAPVKDAPGLEKYHLVNGSLLCNYPIHCFDGWLLSMESKDSILNQLEHPDHYQMPEKLFTYRNNRTLGFYPIESYREDDYEELKDRLKDTNSRIKVPSTSISENYKLARQEERHKREKFTYLRKACTKLMAIVESTEEADENISAVDLARKIHDGDPLTREERMLIFPEFGRNTEQCVNFLTFLGCRKSKLTKNVFKELVERKILEVLDQYSSYCKSNTSNLHGYFGAIFESRRFPPRLLTRNDIERTVGIFCGYIGSRNINFENEDQTFLYVQGWNAAIAFFQERKKRPIIFEDDEPLNESSLEIETLKI